MNYFFTADTHYNHAGLCLGTSKWDDKSACRDFRTVESMNDAIVDGINRRVGEHDCLFLLGDVAFGRGRGPIEEFRSRIVCRNVQLFPGNHDYRLLKDEQLQALFTRVRLKARMKVNGQDIVMQHFPELVWDKHHHGSWMLHGHCHGSLIGPGLWDPMDRLYHDRKIMDVGMDAHPDFVPFSFDEVNDHMAARGIAFIDQHTGDC